MARKRAAPEPRAPDEIYDDEPNPKGDLVACRRCPDGVTFTKDKLCTACRAIVKPSRLQPSAAPEVHR